MLSLAAPLWLLGLGLLPVIRWLHRGGRHRRALPVAHLGLWQGVAAHSPAAGDKQPPDPAWRRRALLVALLLLALAEPRLPPPQRAVTLWVDDSLSMLTREGQGTRLAAALAQADGLLADLARGDIELRTLGEPWQRLGPPGAPAASLAPALEARIAAHAGTGPAAPPAALLRAEREHWLLTDGAHPALQQWPAGRRADRVVQVGSVTRNVGLAGLAARRSPEDANRLDLLATLSNGGDAVETRELVVTGGGAELARSRHRLDPGESVAVTVQVTAQVAAGPGLRATLQPADALVADDELALDLRALRRHRVAVDAGCPPALRAAVAAHPALAPVAADAAGTADAAVVCGGDLPAGGLPALRVQDGGQARPLPGPAQWSDALPASQRLRLPPGPLPVASTLKPQPGDTVLLAAGDEPVLVVRTGDEPKQVVRAGDEPKRIVQARDEPRRAVQAGEGPRPAERARTAPLIETSLDFDALSARRGPETPLLVNLVFERLLAGPLLGAIASAGRGPAASFVVPGPPAAAAEAGPADAVPDRPPAPAAGEGVRPVLWAALLALLWELAALGRQWHRVGRHAGVAGP